MILLRKNQLNKIAVTLSELKSDLLPSNWLFVFHLVQDQNDGNHTKRLQLIDLGVSDKRYNYFELTEGLDVTFDVIGDYRYECYQMPNDTSIDESEGELVEVGMMLLTDESEVEYINTVSTNTYINV